MNGDREGCWIVNRESVGAFIDAVYAIAATILALEIPGDFAAGFSAAVFGQVLLDYAMTFIILFALWQQHRRINALVEPGRNLTVWMTGLALLLVCLVPRATTLVFEYGGDVTLSQLEQSMLHGAGWSQSEFVDLFYVGVVLATDLVLLGLALVATRNNTDTEAVALRQSKYTVSGLIVLVLALSLLVPFENRYFLLVIPIALVFERRFSRLIFKPGRSG